MVLIAVSVNIILTLVEKVNSEHQQKQGQREKFLAASFALSFRAHAQKFKVSLDLKPAN
jgi:hypothetical protein